MHFPSSAFQNWTQAMSMAKAEVEADVMDLQRGALPSLSPYQIEVLNNYILLTKILRKGVIRAVRSAGNPHASKDVVACMLNDAIQDTRAALHQRAALL